MMTAILVLLIALMTSGIAQGSASTDYRKPFTSKIGVHLIRDYTPGSQKMVKGRMPVLKILDPWQPMIDAARDYKKANPDGKVVLRCFHRNKYTLEDNPDKAARQLWDTVIWERIKDLPEADRKLIDYIEGINEMDECPTWQDEESIKWFTRFSIEFVNICHKAGFKPVLACIPVGNPDGSDGGAAKVLQYAPALRAARKVGGVWSYHSYSINYTQDVAEEVWYSLRYRQFYSAFTGEYADLKDMPMILTEGGIDKAGNAATDGWAARGSAEKFQEWIKWLDSELKKDDYILGITLFQNGDPQNWSSFDLEPLADWFVKYWAEKK